MNGIDVRASTLIRDLFDAALESVEPSQSVQNALRTDGEILTTGDKTLPVPDHIHIVAIGKAAAPMANGALAALGARAASTFVLTKHGHGEPIDAEEARVYEAGHPLPDQDTVAGTNALLNHVKSFEQVDVALFLISGGGSAILESPVDGVSLEDFAMTTQLLLQAGAPIQDLNSVRSQISQVKGGGLRRATPVRSAATILLSDVLGNDPETIASGPTVPSTATRAQAIAVLKKYSLEEAVPASVQHALVESDQSPPPSEMFDNDQTLLIADNDKAVDAALARAQALGFPTEVIWREREGEARDLGSEWVDEVIRRESTPVILLGGGEATVTVQGGGLGGRNSEFAVAAADALREHGLSGWTVASLATDGQDALTDAAGGIVNAASAESAEVAADPAIASLEANDTFPWLKKWGEVVAPGPTGTNVNDLYFAVPDALANRLR